MRVLITGITGFIGKNLLNYLPEGHEYIALIRREVDLPKPLKTVRGDLNDLGALRKELKKIKPDICLHMAWEGIPDYGQEISFKNLVNGKDFFRLLVEELGCRKIISIGSCWEYGKKFGACVETDPLGDVGYFARAKYDLCHFGLSLAKERNVNFVWLRLFYVYGPDQREAALIPTLTRALLKNDFPKIKTPLDANDFVYVADIVQALALTVDKELPSGIYNLGFGSSTPVWKVCECLERAVCKEPVHTAQLHNIKVEPTANFWADMSKTSHALNWSATTGIEEGVRRYVKSLEIKI